MLDGTSAVGASRPIHHGSYADVELRIIKTGEQHRRYLEGFTARA
jgi:hypothetical protein